MGVFGRLAEDSIYCVSGQTGLGIERLRHDMQDSAIERYLDESRTPAVVPEIRGTPAFLVGDTLVPGAIGRTRMKELNAAAHSGGKAG